jgi:alcohol dehydrogenase class IV
MNINKLKHRMAMGLASFFIKLMPKSSYMVFVGEQSTAQLCAHICRSGYSNVLIVTDELLLKLGVADSAIAALTSFGATVPVFSEVSPDPTFSLVAKGTELAKSSQCDAILAIGGGSSIDTAKLIAACAVDNSDPRQWVGFGKLKTTPLPIFAVPTTSGTGSEVTRGAVISDDVSHQKAIIADARLLPSAVALDPTLVRGMPPAITAATGMDALTHAIEAYLGSWDFGSANGHSINAVKLIFTHLPKAYSDGNDLPSREAMALAAYYAGIAINEVNVGNVHAIAHQLGGHYRIPHGVANALALPHVLALSLPYAADKLAHLANCIGATTPGQSINQQAQAFIDAVTQLRSDLQLPDTASQLLKQDYKLLSDLIVAEAFTYPTPFLLNEAHVYAILDKLSPLDAAPVSA